MKYILWELAACCIYVGGAAVVSGSKLKARVSGFLGRSHTKSSQLYMLQTVLINRTARWDRDVRIDMYNIRRRH